MKTWMVTIEKHGEIQSTFTVRAINREEAKRFAVWNKRLNSIPGRTFVRLQK